MVCKMICLDIDGTILNSRHEITSHTRMVIRAASKKGIPVVLISARMPKAMVFLKDELGLKDPIACYGGGLILSGDGTVIESKTLETPLVREVSRLADSMGIHVSYYRNDDGVWTKWTSGRGRKGSLRIIWRQSVIRRP